MSLTFFLLLCSAICFAIAAIGDARGARPYWTSVLLPLGLLFLVLPGLIAVWP